MEKSKMSKQKLVNKYKRLVKSSRENGIKIEEITYILKHDGTPKHSTVKRSQIWMRPVKYSLLSFVFYLFVFCDLYMLDIHSFRCLMDHSEVSTEITRPLIDCDMCRNLASVPVEYRITSEDFIRKYAYSSLPVLIKDATTNWTATSTFSYQYFKKIYSETDGALDSVENECQFFPYNTEFETFGDVFNISEARASFAEGEPNWYIGWSNCHKEIKKELRKHYERPYFLPNDSESSSIDWVFMGGSGPGAFVHLDHVQRPSWQAQISGKKTWTLLPSPECESLCKPLNVTVHKGDIFVIDTNVWYHSTFIHRGEISITIGSEYD